MKHLLSFFILGFLCSHSAVIQAADWGIGFSAGSASGLSVQHRFSRNNAGHYRTHYNEDALMMSFDYQRFIDHRFGFLPSSVELYSGFGLSGEAKKEQQTNETFHATIPGGIQWNHTSLRLSAFLEAAARMGPVPKTSMTGQASCGIRTLF